MKMKRLILKRRLKQSHRMITPSAVSDEIKNDSENSDTNENLDEPFNDIENQ